MLTAILAITLLLVAVVLSGTVYAAIVADGRRPVVVIGPPPGWVPAHRHPGLTQHLAELAALAAPPGPGEVARLPRRATARASVSTAAPGCEPVTLVIAVPVTLPPPERDGHMINPTFAARLAAVTKGPR